MCVWVHRVLGASLRADHCFDEGNMALSRLVRQDTSFLADAPPAPPSIVDLLQLDTEEQMREQNARQQGRRMSEMSSPKSPERTPSLLASWLLCSGPPKW